MIQAKATKGFRYLKCASMLEISLGLASPQGTTFKVRKGQTVQCADRYEFEEIRDIARQSGADLIALPEPANR